MWLSKACSLFSGRILQLLYDYVAQYINNTVLLFLKITKHGLLLNELPGHDSYYNNHKIIEFIDFLCNESNYTERPGAGLEYN